MDGPNCAECAYSRSGARPNVHEKAKRLKVKVEPRRPTQDSPTGAVRKNLVRQDANSDKEKHNLSLFARRAAAECPPQYLRLLPESRLRCSENRRHRR